ncbi:MAG: hypothetical protein SGILL_005271 [Bacillariaceae sp.]
MPSSNRSMNVESSDGMAVHLPPQQQRNVRRLLLLCVFALGVAFPAICREAVSTTRGLLDVSTSTRKQYASKSKRKKEQHAATPKNVLFTAFVSDSCDDSCMATRQALIAGTNCAARNMGEEWEPLVVTDFNDPLFQSNISAPFTSSARRKLESGFQGHGPFPHYVKIMVLEQYFFSDRETHGMQSITSQQGDVQPVDWMLWLDADVRVMNATYPISTLLHNQNRYPQSYYGNYNRIDDSHQKEQASVYDNEVSVVVMTDLDYDDIINDIFFIRNNPWGQRFVQAWKHFVLNTENPEDDEAHFRTCGYYDQCPFGIAMLQVTHDYHQWKRQEENSEKGTDNLSSLLLSLPFNETLEDMAFRSGTKVQHTLFKDELGQMVEQPRISEMRDSNMAIQIGPILMIPTWPGGLRVPANDSDATTHLRGTMSEKESTYQWLPTSLSLEPTQTFNQEFQFPWPFGIHAKYSKFFCHRRTPGEYRLFQDLWKSTLLDQCTAPELVSMTNDTAHPQCWSRWKDIGEE